MIILSIIPTFVLIVFWYLRGRDKRYISDTIYYTPDDAKVRNVSIFEKEYIPFVYHPIEDISPSELGAVVDESIDMVDIYAEIFDLSRKSYVDIKNLKDLGFSKFDEYCFVKTDKTTDEEEVNKLKNHQRYLLRELFRFSNFLRSFQYLGEKYDLNDEEVETIGKKISKKEYVLYEGLRFHFHEGISGFREKLYENMVRDGFFYNSPSKVRRMWLFYYLVMNLVVFAIFYLQSLVMSTGFLVFICLIIPGLLICLTMPNKTAKGYSYHRQAVGLKWYLNKSMWKRGPVNKKMFIEEIFPYAVALGVSKHLVNDIKKLDIPPPSYLGIGNSIYKLVSSPFVIR